MRNTRNFGDKYVAWEANDFIFRMEVYKKESGTDLNAVESTLQVTTQEIMDMGLKDLRHKLSNLLRVDGFTQEEIGEVLLYSQATISSDLNSPSPKNLYLAMKR